MKAKIDYSKYECPYSHLEKECGHELHSPEGYQDIYSVWCQCGFRAPVFYLDPVVLGLKLKNNVGSEKRYYAIYTHADRQKYQEEIEANNDDDARRILNEKYNNQITIISIDEI